MYNKDEVFEERKQAAMKANSDTVDVSDLAENISKIDPWTERQNAILSSIAELSSASLANYSCR